MAVTDARKRNELRAVRGGEPTRFDDSDDVPKQVRCRKKYQSTGRQS